MVQPLKRDCNTQHIPHVEATECKSSEGCYFHKSSISKFSGYPLPSDVGTTGSFSEPFACFSGISTTKSPTPTFTYLIWCETDGGCPNTVGARYSFLIQYELLIPNRPGVKDLISPKVVSLPEDKCLISEMSPDTVNFLREGSSEPPVQPQPPKPVKPLTAECGRCRKGRTCVSSICTQNKCVRSLSPSTKQGAGLAVLILDCAIRQTD